MKGSGGDVLTLPLNRSRKIPGREPLRGETKWGGLKHIIMHYNIIIYKQRGQALGVSIRIN
jgi:hypothetical protein